MQQLDLRAGLKPRSQAIALLASALFLLAAAGCVPSPGARPALPTAIPGLVSNDAAFATPGGRATAQAAGGPTSTPAAWATPLPPTPRPPPRSVPHDVAGKADCISCHRGSAYYAVPPDHRNRPSQTCLGCHAAPARAPSAMAHPVAGRQACLSCHLTGLNRARPVPPDHAGRTNDTCGGCHRPK